MNVKIWKFLYLFGVVTLATVLFFQNKTEKFKIDFKHFLQKEDLAVHLVARKLHLLAEDRAFQEGLMQNLSYAVTQSMERYMDSEDFVGVQLFGKNGETLYKLGNWKKNTPGKSFLVAIKLNNGYVIQGLSPEVHLSEKINPPVFYVRLTLLSILALVFGVLSLGLMALVYALQKARDELRQKANGLNALNSDLEKFYLREHRLHQDLKSRDQQLYRIREELSALKGQQAELQLLRIFSDQLSRIFDALRSEQHASDQHIAEALHFLKTDMAKNAMELLRFSENWNLGVKADASSELGPRKFFKQLAEQKDLLTGKTQLELQLSDLQVKTERLNDEVVQSCLNIAAIKNLKTSTLQFFDHWKALLNPAETKKDADVILCFKEAEKMIRSCAFSFACDFHSIMVSGFLNFKPPQASRPILTSVFFHSMLALLYESEGSIGIRTIKPVVQVKQTAQRLILSCFFEGGLRLNQRQKIAKEQWAIVQQLIVGTDLTYERLPPATNMLSLVIQWDAHAPKLIVQNFSKKLPPNVHMELNH